MDPWMEKYIIDLKTDLKEDISQLRADLKKDIHDLSTKVTPNSEFRLKMLGAWFVISFVITCICELGIKLMHL